VNGNPTASVNDPAFWQSLYAKHQDGWELGEAHPSLVHLVESAPPPRGRVAVPGCGRGHDVLFLNARGWQALGFDFTATAVSEARRLAQEAGVAAAFEQRDIFTLPDDYTGAFDGVWESTCYCAIDPGRRAEYVATMATILRHGGWFIACFYPVRAGDGGPPFPVDLAEMRQLLAPHFRIASELPPPRPVPRRAGQEWLVHAVRKSSV
jgi:SAM-dependent methyltransferase